MKELTPKERAFLQAYFNKDSPTYSNGTQSIKRAGYKVGSDLMAGVLAHKILKKDKIMTKIAEQAGEFKLDLSTYLSDLDKKLKSAGKTVTLSREWIQGLRLAAELAGKLGSGHQVNIAILQKDVQSGKPCPVCGASCMGESRLAEILESAKVEGTQQIRDAELIVAKDS